ncbi:MAG: AgmX/PglI C-terminal domain-containing protein [Candidatus Oleimicrobiaceae bacterium]
MAATAIEERIRPMDLGETGGEHRGAVGREHQAPGGPSPGAQSGKLNRTRQALGGRMEGGVTAVVRKGAKWALAIGCVATLLVVRMWQTGQGEEQPSPTKMPGPEFSAAQEFSQLAVGGTDEAVQQPARKEIPVSAARAKVAAPAEAANLATVSDKGQLSPTHEGNDCNREVPSVAQGKSWIAALRSGNLESLERPVSLPKHQGEGQAAVRDVRSPAFIAEVLARHNQEIQECYRQRVKINPSLEGRIDLRFEVAPDGSVSRVEVVESTLDDAELESCLVSSMLRWNDFGRCAPQKGPHVYRQQYTFGVENR